MRTAIALIGFGNDPICQDTHPALSSVQRHAETRTHAAIDLLLKILNKEAPYEPGFHEIETELVIRESTRPDTGSGGAKYIAGFSRDHVGTRNVTLVASLRWTGEDASPTLFPIKTVGHAFSASEAQEKPGGAERQPG